MANISVDRCKFIHLSLPFCGLTFRGLKVDQISLNLTVLEKKSHDFFKFLDLIGYEQNVQKPACFNVAFEPVLKTVRFPDFECMLRREEYSSQNDLRSKSLRRIEDFNNLDLPSKDELQGSNLTPKSGRRDEVSKVLRWLYDIKGVRKIYQLVVPDYFVDPHTEETIENAIKPFEVETLDWRRLDLGIDSIQASAPEVRRLHLYSSGNRAALSHWYSSEGIKTLKQVFNASLMNRLNMDH